MSAHYIEKCSCGTVLGQCRCPSSNKTERIIPNGCGKCRPASALPVDAPDGVRVPRDEIRVLIGRYASARITAEATDSPRSWDAADAAIDALPAAIAEIEAERDAAREALGQSQRRAVELAEALHTPVPAHLTQPHRFNEVERL